MGSTARLVRAKADLALMQAVAFGLAADDPEMPEDEWKQEAVELERAARAYAKAVREHGEVASLSHLRLRDRETAIAFLVTCIEYDKRCQEQDPEEWKAGVLELERTAQAHYAVIISGPVE